jgi:hypothetical protein
LVAHPSTVILAEDAGLAQPDQLEPPAAFLQSFDLFGRGFIPGQIDQFVIRQ